MASLLPKNSALAALIERTPHFFLEESPYGLFILDKNFCLAAASSHLLTSLGIEAEEAAGTPLDSFSSPLAVPAPGDTTRSIATWKRRSGHPLQLEVQLSRQEIDGEAFFIGLFREEAAENKNQSKLRRLARVNLLLSQANNLMAEAQEDDSLLSKLCSLFVSHGALPLAWFGRSDEQGWIRPIAASGETEFLDEFMGAVDERIPEGQSIVDQVFRSGRPRIFSSLTPLTQSAPVAEWKARVLRAGFQSAGFLPVSRGGRTWGVLSLYSREPDAFASPLPPVLESLSESLSRALDRLDLQRREKESTALQKALLDNILSGILLLENRTITLVNDRLLRMLGYDDSSDLVGRSIRILYAREEDFERTGQILKKRLPQEGSVLLSDVPMKKKNGETLWVDSSASQIRVGERTIVVGTFQDVTERHERSERLLKLSDFNSLLARTISFLAETDTERTLLQGFCDLAIQTDNLSLIRISRPDADGWLRTLAAAGKTLLLKDLRVSIRENSPHGQTPGAQTWRDQTPRFNVDLLQASAGVDPEREALFQKWGFKSSAFLPILRGGEVWGLLSIHHLEPDAFDKALCGILQEMAKNLGRSLDRLDLKRREAELYQVQKALLDNTVSGILMARNRTLVSVNSRLAEIFGYDNPEEMIGMHARSLYADTDEYHRIGALLYPAVFQNRIVDVTGFKGRKKDGSSLVLDLSATSASHPESNTIIITFEDRTDRYAQAERLLRLSTYNTLLSQTRQAMTLIGEEEPLILEICRVSVQKCGFSLAWIGRPGEDHWFTILAAQSDRVLPPRIVVSSDPSVPEGQGPAGRCWRHHQIETAGTIDTLFPSLDRSHQLSPEEILRTGLQSGAALPIHRNGKIWAVLGVYDTRPHSFHDDVLPFLDELAHDLSRALDRIDLARREREVRSLQEILLSNTVVGIMVSENRQIRYVNRRLVEIFGYDDPEDLLGKDSRLLYSTMEEYLRTGSLLYPAVYRNPSVSIRNIHAVKKDGSPVRINLSCSHFNANGQSRLVATLTDVTDQVLQEEQLARLSRYSVFLAEVRRLVATAHEEDRLFKTLCDLATLQGIVDFAWIGAPDEHGWFCLSHVSSPEGWADGLRLSVMESEPEGCGAAGNAWRMKSPRFYRTPSLPLDLPIPDSWKSLIVDRGIRSTAAIPLFRNQELIALFCFLDRRDHAFDPDLQKILLELGTSLSEGLDRLDLVKRQGELATLNQAIIDNALAGFILTDSKSKTVIHINPLQQKELGYPKSEEMSGQPFRLLLADDQEMDRIFRMCEDSRSGEGIRVPDARLRHREGHILLYDLFGRRVGAPGNDRFLWTTVNVTERNRLQAQIEHEATHDLLTGLLNRRGLEQALLQALARSRRNGTSLALGFLDLDDFKPVNDRWGHGAGDRLLQEFAARCRTLLRQTDLFARLGGDEFVVVMEGLDSECADQSERSLASALNRLHQAVESPFAILGKERAWVSMTMGIALYPEDGETPDTLLRRADQAMYALKAHKRDRAVWWRREKGKG